MLLVWLAQGIWRSSHFRPFSIPFSKFIFVKLYPAIVAFHYWCFNPILSGFTVIFHHYFISTVKWYNLLLDVCISEICCRNWQLLSIQFQSMMDMSSNKRVKINVGFFFLTARRVLFIVLGLLLFKLEAYQRPDV